MSSTHLSVSSNPEASSDRSSFCDLPKVWMLTSLRSLQLFLAQQLSPSQKLCYQVSQVLQIIAGLLFFFIFLNSCMLVHSQKDLCLSLSQNDVFSNLFHSISVERQTFTNGSSIFSQDDLSFDGFQAQIHEKI